MLSYRHSFHAGNFADVLKHIVLIEILEYLLKKDSAFDYIDTHAGAGLYNLMSEHAKKLREHSKGVGLLKAEEWPELESYFKLINSCNKESELIFYPGSPLIAMHYLRANDRGWLYEMHPADFALLEKNNVDKQRVRALCEDGFRGLLSLLPPVSRRGLVLIDPAYEIKTDYARMVETLTKAYKKFATGSYAIWYPVVDRKRIDWLERRFVESGIKNIQRYELGITKDSADTGMTAAGMIVINPPWTLMDKMSHLLPRLVDTLGTDDGAFFKCDTLVGE